MCLDITRKRYCPPSPAVELAYKSVITFGDGTLGGLVQFARWERGEIHNDVMGTVMPQDGVPYTLASCQDCRKILKFYKRYAYPDTALLVLNRKGEVT